MYKVVRLLKESEGKACAIRLVQAERLGMEIFVVEVFKRGKQVDARMFLSEFAAEQARSSIIRQLGEP